MTPFRHGVTPIIRFFSDLASYWYQNFRQMKLHYRSKDDIDDLIPSTYRPCWPLTISKFVNKVSVIYIPQQALYCTIPQKPGGPAYLHHAWLCAKNSLILYSDIHYIFFLIPKLFLKTFFCNYHYFFNMYSWGVHLAIAKNNFADFFF